MVLISHKWLIALPILQYPRTSFCLKGAIQTNHHYVGEASQYRCSSKRDGPIWGHSNVEGWKDKVEQRRKKAQHLMGFELKTSWLWGMRATTVLQPWHSYCKQLIDGRWWLIDKPSSCHAWRSDSAWASDWRIRGSSPDLFLPRFWSRISRITGRWTLMRLK